MARIKMNRTQIAANDFIAARRKGLDSTSIRKIDGSADVYPGTLESYYKYIASHPDEIPTSFNYEMGNIYLNTGKFDSAYRYLFMSYQSDSANGYILYSIASCIYLRGNTGESLKWFERSFRTKALELNFVDQDMLLRPLQDEKRFRDLKKKYF
jgi:tetratricopeptide (TPR) repeat protein